MDSMEPGEKRLADDLSVELVRRIQGGDAAAFDALYRRYHDPLLFAVRARMGTRLRNALESEDLLQSVFKDTLRDIQRFEPHASGSLAHWLHVCVLNKIRGKAAYLGAEKRSGAVPLEEDVADARSGEGVAYLDEARWGALEPALTSLDDVSREVVILRAVEGLSNEETARHLERTPAATSKLYNRALARLSVLLAARRVDP